MSDNNLKQYDMSQFVYESIVDITWCKRKGTSNRDVHRIGSMIIEKKKKKLILQYIDCDFLFHFAS